MRYVRADRLARLLFLCMLLLGRPGVAAEIVHVDVSSAASRLGQAAAADFMKQSKTARVAVGVSGVIPAFEKLCRGEIPLALVSRPILSEEAQACARAKVDFVELPLALDAFTVIVNAKNTFVESLSLEQLRRIWEPGAQAAITHWAQLDSRWPDRPLKLLGPALSSGEAMQFNVAVLGNDSARRDYMGSAEDRMLIEAVERDVYALAYVALSAYAANRSRVKAIPIALKPGAGAVAPTGTNVARGAYPALTRAIFLYVSVDALKRPEVSAFSEHLVRNAGAFARRGELIALTETIYLGGVSRLRARRAGSAWGGALPVGLTIEALQRKSSSM